MKLIQLTKLMLCAALAVLTTACCSLNPKECRQDPCGSGLVALNAKLVQAANGSVKVDVSSEHGALHGIPVKADINYVLKDEKITQCVMPSFAALVAKRPEIFDFTVDDQNGFRIATKK